MTNKFINGTIHNLPKDMAKALLADRQAFNIWQSLTPLARNEWICWTISPKKASTRQQHVERVVSRIKAGKRRPCCWIGCIHRPDKPLSPSVNYILSKQKQ